MRFSYLITLIAVFATQAFAAPTTMHYRDGQNQLWLYPSACVNPQVIEQIPGEVLPRFRAARINYNGQDFAGCWVIIDEDVFLVYEDGDRGRLHRSVFRQEVSI